MRSRRLPSLIGRFFGPPEGRRSRRAWGGPEAALEALEPRVLLTDPNGFHDLEFIGRADDGTWYASRYDLGERLPGPVESTDTGTVVFERWNPNVNWVDVRTGDFDGDGLTDIVGRDGSTGDWWATLSDGVGATNRYGATWAPGARWADVAVADLAAVGDRGTRGHFTNKDDLIGRASDGTWYAAVSNGDGTFTNRALFWWNPAARWRDVQVADFNGDGAAEVAGRTSGGDWFAAMSLAGTGESLGYETVFLGTWWLSAGWRDVQASDGDIYGRAADGTWWKLTVAGGWSGGTRTVETGVTSYLGSWRETAGWRDVMVDRGTAYGRTAAGEWWAGFNLGSTSARLVGSWVEAAGWRDVQAVEIPHL